MTITNPQREIGTHPDQDAIERQQTAAELRELSARLAALLDHVEVAASMLVNAEIGLDELLKSLREEPESAPPGISNDSYDDLEKISRCWRDIRNRLELYRAEVEARLAVYHTPLAEASLVRVAPREGGFTAVLRLPAAALSRVERRDTEDKFVLTRDDPAKAAEALFGGCQVRTHNGGNPHEVLVEVDTTI